MLAFDKFRGSLSASEARREFAAGLLDVAPSLVIEELAVADGGEGTLESFIASGFRCQPVTSRIPVADGQTPWRYASDGTTAVIELAALSGLGRSEPTVEKALWSTSEAVGEAILAALETAHTSIILGLGGSASTDGGAGMMHALGLRLFDAEGISLTPGADALSRIRAIDASALDPRLSSVKVVVAADVDNPLLGVHGAAVTFAPQKGADWEAVIALEEGVERYSTAVVEATKVDHRDDPGAGAAGGVGFSALTFLGASIRSGIDIVLESQQFDRRAADADLIVTGEGSLDPQSLAGKAPVGVARRAKALGIPVCAVVGRSRLTVDESAAAGFECVYTFEDLEPDTSRSMRNAATLIRRIGRTVAREHLASAPTVTEIPTTTRNTQ